MYSVCVLYLLSKYGTVRFMRRCRQEWSTPKQVTLQLDWLNMGNRAQGKSIYGLSKDYEVQYKYGVPPEYGGGCTVLYCTYSTSVLSQVRSTDVQYDTYATD
jgi:hypothetical protein